MDKHSLRRPISLASITQENHHELAMPRKSTGFYVDMSEDSSGDTETGAQTKAKPIDDKQHLFTMFIDVGSPAKSSRGPPRLSSSLQRLNRDDNGAAEPTDDDPSLVQLRHKSDTRQDPRTRHSWNPTAADSTNLFLFDNEPPANNGAREESCSASVTSGDHGYQSMPAMQPPKTMRSLSVNSSNSIYSSHEDVVALRQPHRGAEPSLNDTFSKDSVESMAESLSKRDSSLSDADEVTYIHAADKADMKRRNTSFNNFQKASLTFVRKSSDPMLQLNADNQLFIEEVTTHRAPLQSGADKVRPHTMESLQATIEKQQKLLLETVNEEVPLASFVRLSDMDKPLARADWMGGGTGASEHKLSRSAGSTTTGNPMRSLGGKGNSSGGRSGASMSRSMGTNLTNLASSIETLRSLSRLFPHLSDELNTNGAAAHIDDGSPAKSVATLAGDHQDYVLSDLSATSSVTSSYSRSGMDSADEWSLSNRQPRRLGEDLLKMFLQELATDVTIDIAGRPIRAHKCILRSRCQYFAAMLAGDDAHKSRITLPGYSFGSVHFALCHIYSGASHPPHGISLFELAALADMLSLEGLKEVTTFALRTHFCHKFHKPCTGCIDGIMQVFPVSLQHGLDDLYQKCLRWTCKHYVMVWPTRAFAQLPNDIIDRCTQYLVAHINSETVLTLIINCDHLVTILSSCRWAIGVENTVRDLIDTARAYIADHFANLLASDCFLSLGQDQHDNIGRLENLLLRTASTLTPEQACRSYQRATRLNGALRAKVSASANADENAHWNDEFLRFVEAILLAVEHCLTRQCARAMRSQQWQRMELELRKRIQALACLTDSMESKRSSSKHVSQESALATWNSPRHVPDMQQVKLAIESLSRRSKEGRYSNKEPERDPHLDKVTKLRKPVAVSSAQPRPTTIHVVPSRPAAPDITKLRTFKHSISLDASKPTPKTAAKPTGRFSEIRPRYLEPKTRVSTQSTENLAAAKRDKHPRSIINASSTKSINSIGLSRDSLVAINRNKQASRSNTIMSKDSLNTTFTCNRTNQSASRESLVKHHTLSSVARLKKPASLSGTSSTDHSPTTTRSSRFSSAPSCASSPRDVVTRRTSTTTPSASGTAMPRKSFLSAKSREILAAKSRSLNRTESVRLVPTSAPVADGRALNKSSSVSSIPARRPPTHPMVTTLHLRRTAKLPEPSQAVALDVRAKKASATAANMRIKSEMEKEKRIDQHDAVGAELSLMQRSITFCKDSSDLPDDIGLTIVE